MGAPLILCPYCGSLSPHAKQCNICTGYFDLLSRQRSQNAMGPWFLRDIAKPFQPGCSYATLVRMAQRGRIKPETVLRGPSTRQFWSFARQTPGVAHLLGECHACHKPVMPTATSCANCKASFVVADDRQTLGLSPIHLLPGDADAATIARSLGAPSQPASQAPPRPAEMPAPVDVAPVPEPQVVVEEPEWIDEPRSPSSRASHPRERADRSPGSRVGVVIAVLVVIVMMGGAGVWAWLHLSKRADVAQAPGPVAQIDPAPVEPSETIAPAEEPGEPPVGETPAPETDPETAQADSEPPPTTQPQPDPGRVAYDRLLVDIAEGTLDEAALSARLQEVAPGLREGLREAWERRAEQIRLGRRGE